MIKWFLILLFVTQLSYAQQRVIDKKFIILNGSYLTAALLDSELTQHCINNKTCVEGNSWMPKSQAGQLGVAFGMTAGAVGVSYYLRKHHVPMWWLPTTIGITAHGYGISTGWRFSH